MKVVSNMVEAHVFRQSGDGIEFLLLKRAEKEIYPGLWQMVTGKIKKKEKAFETALREIKEETGLVPLNLWVVPNVNPFYSHEKDYVSILPVFAAKVKNDSIIKICDEHCEYKWAEPGEAKSLFAWPGQSRSVDIITDYFLNKLSFLNMIEIKL
ncbi:MAG TPA: NUDIX pyrophosphatase [Ignavibacteriaceae bacterium]|nr:NUDIX pyrophosphatase [Ignavibacteriaceae bacterium]